MEGLEHVREAGMDPYLNITVGHYNANTEHFKKLLDYSRDKKYRTLLNVAVPSGMWQKMTEIICDEKDREYLKKIRNKDGKYKKWKLDGIAARVVQHEIDHLEGILFVDYLDAKEN